MLKRFQILLGSHPASVAAVCWFIAALGYAYAMINYVKTGEMATSIVFPAILISGVGLYFISVSKKDDNC
ncbi:MAG: hypothetical protein JKY34_05230 [Kordiimonadaceae bacterium]|nr:hypothetical protein [Kordiimonadaceae bacterium]